MTKYEPLKTFLAHSQAAEVPMRFSEIEQIIGAPLPPVAFRHRAWWSNNPVNSVITAAWLEAGYKTQRVDMAAQRLVFRRAADRPLDSSSLVRSATRVNAVTGGGLLGRLRHALGGTVRIAEGVDLTAPSDAAWDAEAR
ncbi:MAG TPA: hypothetical protein VHZ26_05760 [Caulobacteraceae bacterium]|jgi:hypothetical protein|nr:hypothetical protein [Caulobacteraceae bacterium]